MLNNDSTAYGATMTVDETTFKNPSKRFSLPFPAIADGDKSAEQPEFEEFRPLVAAETTATEYPISALGRLQRAVEAIAQNVQVPSAMAANSCLSAVAISGQGLANVSIDQRISPISLFLATVAESGDRKDSTDKAAFLPIYDHQQALADKFKNEESEFNDALEVFEEARKHAKSSNKKKGKDAMYAAVRDLGPRPERPLHPILLVTDLTIVSRTM